MAGRNPRRRLGFAELRKRVDDSLNEAESLASLDDRGESAGSLGMAVNELEAAALDLAEARRRLRWAASRERRALKLIARIRKVLPCEKLKHELALTLTRVEKAVRSLQPKAHQT